MSQHILLNVNDASGSDAQVHIFVEEMKKAAWEEITSVTLAFYKVYPTNITPGYLEQEIERAVGDAAFTADFGKTFYVYTASPTPPISGHYKP